MVKLTTNPHGNQEPGHAKDSSGIARLGDDAPGWKKGNQKGVASPNQHGDKIAMKLVAKAGKNPALSPTPATADRTNNLQVYHEPLHAGNTRTSKAQPTDYACEAKNGKKQGPASPKPGLNNTVKNVAANETMDDCVKKEKQSNAEGCGAPMEKTPARGKPLPKRGDVTKGIVREVVAGVKKVIDTGKAFCCAPEPFDVDAFVEDLPSPTRSEPTATVWAKFQVEV